MNLGKMFILIVSNLVIVDGIINDLSKSCLRLFYGDVTVHTSPGLVRNSVWVSRFGTMGEKKHVKDKLFFIYFEQTPIDCRIIIIKKTTSPVGQ